MEQDLHITGDIEHSYSINVRLFPSDVQYATVIAILFVSYCPAQVPSNMVCKFHSVWTKYLRS